MDGLGNKSVRARANAWTRCGRALPNALSLLRLPLAGAMLLVAPFSPAFFALYLLCGLTDALDGALARRLGLQSALGALLDSVADAMFFAVALARTLPALNPPGWVWGLIALIVLVRAAALILARVRFGRMAFLHTWLNKAAGLAVYAALPLFGLLPHAPLYALVCGTALAAAAEECALNCLKDAPDANVRSIALRH